MNIGIIGGGPAGMLSAITAARSGHNVTILEHNNRIGKKLLSTGSGKCNLTNEDMSMNHFHGGNLELIEHIISSFNYKDTISFFENYGLLTKSKNGYIYPYNEQASAVLDLLRAAINSLSIQVVTCCNINDICCLKNHSGFKINTSITNDDLIDKAVFKFDKLIIASGSKAAPKTGSDGSCYKFIVNLGHHVIEPLPALCGLRCAESYFKSLKGIRCKASVQLFVNNTLVGNDEGELQLNDYGVSGIPVMQLSFLASKSLNNKCKVKLRISFMPDFNEDTLYSYIKNRINNNPYYRAEDLFLSVFHKNLAVLLLKKSNINPSKICKDINEVEIKSLCSNILFFETNVIETNSFNESQVCSGGVDLNEVNKNLQSKIINGLYFAGEVLDVNGDCGGYNLQWAWSSGHMAGSLL